jgi:hypothetical protein
MSKVCPDCGAPLEGTATQCWLCRAQRHAATHDINPYASPQPLTALAVKNQFSLATLFLIMTLAAVALGALRVAPGLGVFLIVLSVPALARSVIAGRRRLESGETPTVWTKIVDFAASVAIVWMILIAAQIAFGVACIAAGLPASMLLGLNGGLAIFIALGAGLAAAAFIATWLWRITRPKSRVSTP